MHLGEELDVSRKERAETRATFSSGWHHSSRFAGLRVMGVRAEYLALCLVSWDCAPNPPGAPGGAEARSWGSSLCPQPPAWGLALSR